MIGFLTDRLLTSWTNVFNQNIVATLVKRREILTQYSVELLLLRILILMLSSDTSRQFKSTDIDDICDDTLLIFAAQNKYVELLWRYIASRASTQKDVVIFFNKLILFLLYIQKLNAHVDTQILESKDEFKKLTPLVQAMWPAIDEE